MYYLDDNNNPVMSNAPEKTWTLIDKKRYDEVCTQKNAEAEASRLAIEEALKPIQEYEAKIQAKLREIAIKEIEKEGKR
jgi:hypothetical protein